MFVYILNKKQLLVLYTICSVHKIRTRLFYLVLAAAAVCFLGSHATGQSRSVLAPDSSKQAVQEAITLFHQALGRNARIYSGAVYAPYNRPSKGHPFLGNGEWADATILFDGVLYPQIPLLYDVVSDMAVIGYAGDSDPLQKFVLVRERTHYFTINDRRFVAVQDSTNQINGGYYEELFNGSVQVLAKRSKQVTNRPSELIFAENDRFYVHKLGHFYPVNSKSSLLKVFKEHKAHLVTFIKDQKIDFRQDKGLAIARVAAHYHQMTTAND
ncbi:MULTISPECIES: hypothetical protein [Rufibacter]|uniref:Uncharacterized protein n=1 Tax=Rufibacter quisquiliarum TaxID=1549639 RepID=A0A839GUQ8_9BACT|nr:MULTISPECIES: hypothetical protein [Rufibacter]MBA9078158.1 hypothetical protein [Rufibacter quisquiliarum]